MKIVVDGYNLMMTCGFVSPERIGPGALRRARMRLIGILQQRLPRELHSETTVVFDSSMSLIENSDFEQTSIRVLFSSEFEDADAMIEELIRKHSAPKRLMVVSSDHRIQNAARRRKATAVDSDDWFFDQLGVAKSSVEVDRPTEDEMLKLNEKLISETESETWTELFRRETADSSDEELFSEERGESASSKQEVDDEIYNPFPDGYVDDLLEDD